LNSYLCLWGLLFGGIDFHGSDFLSSYCLTFLNGYFCLRGLPFGGIYFQGSDS